MVYCVYNGNYPQVVRDTLALRVHPNNEKIFKEVEPKTEQIEEMDVVWKPANFVRQPAYDFMSKRCENNDRPFLYCHFGNIGVITSKPGLIRTLREYYNITPKFKKAGYTLEHTMAISFVIPSGDCLQNEELSSFRKIFSKLSKKDLAGEVIPARQMEKNFWILKPENENRGRGIEIVTNFREVVGKLYSKASGDNYVIKKYLE